MVCVQLLMQMHNPFTYLLHQTVQNCIDRFLIKTNFENSINSNKRYIYILHNSKGAYLLYFTAAGIEKIKFS